MADQNTLTFTDANFDTDVLPSDLPVLVDVWSEGCGACRQLAPLINVVASEYAGKAKVGKLDALSNLNLAMQYQVRALPTLLIFKAGSVVSQRTGVLDKEALRKWIDSHL